MTVMACALFSPPPAKRLGGVRGGGRLPSAFQFPPTPNPSPPRNDCVGGGESRLRGFAP